MDRQNLVIVLAFLKAFPKLREDELLGLITESLYLDFFQAKEALNALKEQNLISFLQQKDEREKDAHGRSVARLVLNPAGEAVADELKKQLPEELRRYIEKTACHYYQRTQTAHQASIESLFNGSYLLRLESRELGSLLFSLEIKLPTLELSKKIKAAWEENPAASYAKLLDCLLTLGD